MPTVLTHQAPPLLYDYYGFPSEAYRLAWPAPGAPQLAARVRQLLNDAGVKSAEDSSRGFDHGVFVPMLVAFPEAQVPVTQLSLLSSLDPGQHIALGAALEPLSAENVLILASGFSFHNMAGFGSSLLSGENPTGAAAFSVRTASHAFDDWLVDTLAGTQHDAEERRRRISAWSTAPNGACGPAFALMYVNSTLHSLRVPLQRSAGMPPQGRAPASLVCCSGSSWVCTRRARVD